MLVFFAFTYYLPGDENIVVDDSPIVGLPELLDKEQSGLRLFDLYPNPAKQASRLRYFSPENEKAAAKIISVEGKVVREWPVALISGFNEFDLNLENIAPGQYFINVHTGNSVQTKTLIIYE